MANPIKALETRRKLVLLIHLKNKIYLNYFLQLPAEPLPGRTALQLRERTSDRRHAPKRERRVRERARPHDQERERGSGPRHSAQGQPDTLGRAPAGQASDRQAQPPADGSRARESAAAAARDGPHGHHVGLLHRKIFYVDSEISVKSKRVLTDTSFSPEVEAAIDICVWLFLHFIS